MGNSFFSMHFKSGDAETVRKAAAEALRAGRAFVSRPIGGWINVYPSKDVQEARLAARIAAAAKLEHAVALALHDSDVLCYWYIRNGKLADYFNSCPGYFGNPLKADLAARGNPAAFSGLLDKRARSRLARLVASRMIDGEEVGGAPPFETEEERLEAIARLLKIRGASGSYDYLAQGETIKGIGTSARMAAVGRAAETTRRQPAGETLPFRFRSVVISGPASARVKDAVREAIRALKSQA